MGSPDNSEPADRKPGTPGQPAESPNATSGDDETADQASEHDPDNDFSERPGEWYPP